MRSRFLILVLIVIFLIMGSILIVGFSMTEIFTQPREGFMCEGCNLVIFTIDTLRADHLSSYGYFQETSPVIDSFGREGITFTSAFSQVPLTPPSHWSIFTGLYAHKHNKFSPRVGGSGLTTLPDILKDNGYTTSGFISSEMLWGFINEFDYINGHDDEWGKYEIFREGFFESVAGETTKDVLSWLGNHSSERFFLWVHYFDPHSPYDPPEEHDIYNYEDESFYSDVKYENTGLSEKRTIRSDIAKYDGEVRYSDENVGVVLEKLKELNLDDNTLVILLSDHGECFGEHDFSDFGYEEDKPCVFHGKTLYDEEIRVPLIIKNPRFPLRGIKIDNMVETVDILPTVLDTLGLEYDLEIDGESLVSLIENKERTKGYTISQMKPMLRGTRPLAIGIRTEERKFVSAILSKLDLEKAIGEQEGKSVNFTENEEEGVTKKLLFKVNEGETENFIDSEKEVAESLEKQLRDIISVGFLPESVEIDKRTEELLRSLGYIV